MLQDTVSALSKSLTVPFALAVGLSSVVSLSGLVTTVGLAEIVACSIAMSGYLAGQTEVKHYAAEQALEHREIEELPDVERRRVQEMLAAMGLSPSTSGSYPVIVRVIRRPSLLERGRG